MKKRIEAWLILIMLCLSLCAQAAGGSMQVVNCEEWVSLRETPSTSAARICTVPLGETVTDCEEAANGFTRCTYKGETGYILTSYLEAVPDETEGKGTSGPAELTYAQARGSGEEVMFEMRSEYTFAASRTSDGIGEKTLVGCFLPNGRPVWGYQTETDFETELSLTCAFMAGTDALPLVMVYNAAEGLHALNAMTGEEEWFLPEETVSLGASNCWAVGDDGTLYMAGYYGPDPVAIRADGTVLWQSHTDSPDLFWPYRITVTPVGIQTVYDAAGQEVTAVFDRNGNRVQ